MSKQFTLFLIIFVLLILHISIYFFKESEDPKTWQELLQPNREELTIEQRDNDAIKLVNRASDIYESYDSWYGFLLSSNRFQGSDGNTLIPLLGNFKEFVHFRDENQKAFCIHYKMNDDSRGVFYKSTQTEREFTDEPC